MTDVTSDEKNFELGQPVLVCRWRLANRTLPLENRHLRALSQRRVNGAAVSTQLVAWAKQHIEWTLSEGAATAPDGTLMLVVDDRGQAAMSVGPYEALDATSTDALTQRALLASIEGEKTGVAPETLWAVLDGALICGLPEGPAPSGASSLVADLARTLGLCLSYDEALAKRVLSDHFDEVFLVSDEHGVVPAADAGGPVAKRLADGYAKLLDAARR